MNKYVLKATALAIGALVGGVAFAAPAVVATVDLADATTAKTFAKELAYGDANPVTLATVGSETYLSFTTKLGFGVAASTTRYIRIDLGNAKFNADVGNAIGTDIEIGSLTAGQSNVAISAGGAAGDSYVILAVAVSGTDVAQAASADVNFLIPSLRFQGSASDVTVTYSLHETGTSAVAGATAGTAVLASKTGTLAKFASSVDFSAPSTGSAVASVEDSFKKFKAGADVSGAANQTVRLGTVKVAAKTNLKNSGAAVTLADLFDAATKITVTGDLSVPAGADDTAKKASVWLNGDDTCTSTGPTAAAAVPTAAGASFTTGTAAVATHAICYTTNGTGAIAAAEYKVKLEVTPKTGTTTASVGDQTFGSITRDGTELLAPFATIHPDYTSRVFLTSTHTSDAVVTATAKTDDGSTCADGVTLPTLKAGKQIEYKIKDICPSIAGTGNTTRLSVSFTIAAPKSKISGSYNQYLNKFSGAAAGSYGSVTGDMNSYVLIAPAN